MTIGLWRWIAMREWAPTGDAQECVPDRRSHSSLAMELSLAGKFPQEPAAFCRSYACMAIGLWGWIALRAWAPRGDALG